MQPHTKAIATTAAADVAASISLLGALCAVYDNDNHNLEDRAVENVRVGKAAFWMTLGYGNQAVINFVTIANQQSLNAAAHATFEPGWPSAEAASLSYILASIVPLNKPAREAILTISLAKKLVELLTAKLCEAKYPGDTVRIARFSNGTDYGDVRIQRYDDCLRVGAFLPGQVVENPGDTPKVEPEKSEWFTPGTITQRSTNRAPIVEAFANGCFDRYVREALSSGWVRA